MRRTALVYCFPAAIVASAWLRLEEPSAGGSETLWIVLLALVPAVLPSLGLRLLATGPVLLFAAWIALDRPLGEGGFFPVAWQRFDEGLVRFYDVRVPFSGAEYPEMHGVVLLAIFGFCLGLGLAAASRRPVPTVLVLLAGAGWPATLLPSEGIGFGALILVAALWILAGLRAERPTLALAAGVLVVLVAAGASTSAAVARDGMLAWQRWDPYGGPDAPVSVSYVWDANYGGIDFPKEETTVLRISGTDRSLYWRATTLNTFTEDRWIEQLDVHVSEFASGELPNDPLLPEGARNEDALVTQDVQVVGLRDRHVIAASTPVGLDGDSLGLVTKYGDGVVELNRDLERGERYTVSSYAPRPRQADLALLEADYPLPGELDRYFKIGRKTLPTFGSPGRAEAVAEIFEDEGRHSLSAYEGVSQQAERIARGARTPYGAVVAIEAWLRTTGGFVYDEQPPSSGGAPPLAYFVAEGKRGYCQQFAGSMALMLRFLGIPARVAAGFTSGRYREGVWTVTDHNAHAWVEVWFPEYGWLTFDPTPGRGAPAGGYSAASESFNADAASRAFEQTPGREPDPGTGVGQLIQLQDARARGATPVTVEEGIGAFWVLVGLVAAIGLAIGLGKLAWRRSRYLTSDPRRVAGAARRELADFLVDQGLTVDASATPEDLHQLVRSQLGIDGRPFATAVAAARFGPLDGSEAAAAATRIELKRLLHAIRGSLGRPQRLRGFVTLRSLRA